MNWARAFFGVLILAVGTVLLLDNLDVLDAGEFIADWWPAALVLGGIMSFVANPRHWIGPLLLVVGGTVVLLQTLDVVDSVASLLPLGLIVLGLLVIFGRGFGSRTEITGDRIRNFNLFSGSKLASTSRHFEGGSIGAIFGGAEVDLTQSSLADGATLDVFVMFGGIELSVPKGWRVDVNGLPIFGAYENATATEVLPAEAPHLRIDATTMFGGLEVKH